MTTTTTAADPCCVCGRVVLAKRGAHRSADSEQFDWGCTNSARRDGGFYGDSCAEWWHPRCTGNYDDDFTAMDMLRLHCPRCRRSLA